MEIFKLRLQVHILISGNLTFDGSPCDCDTVILLRMDREWKNVLRVYIIPSAYIETLCISIYTGSIRVSKWDKFMVDEKSYNDAYHTLDIENCSILRNE